MCFWISLNNSIKNFHKQVLIMHIKFKKIIWLFLSGITLLIGLMLLFNNQIKNEMVRQNQVIGLKSLTKKIYQKK